MHRFNSPISFRQFCLMSDLKIVVLNIRMFSDSQEADQLHKWSLTNLWYSHGGRGGLCLLFTRSYL